MVTGISTASRSTPAGADDFDWEDVSFGRTNENRAYHIGADNERSRGHTRYAADRAYQGGYYGREGNYDNRYSPEKGRWKEWGEGRKLAGNRQSYGYEDERSKSGR